MFFTFLCLFIIGTYIVFPSSSFSYPSADIGQYSFNLFILLVERLSLFFSPAAYNSITNDCAAYVHYICSLLLAHAMVSPSIHGNGRK